MVDLKAWSASGLEHLRDRLSASGTTPSYIKSIELVIFALIVPVLGRLLFSADPVGLNSGFAWAAVLPVIFAARYGAAWGLGCALLATVALMVPTAVYADQTVALTTLAVGTIVMSIIVGDATNGTRRTSLRAQAENEYLRHRLKEFSNDYHVLKVSHGQLEEYMAGQRHSLRYALQQLKPVLSSKPDGLEAGSELMAIFAQFCSIQVAGLYAMKSPTSVDPEPVATHGDMPDLPLFDQLLNLALKERKLVSIKLDSLASDHHSSGLLAVVPIVDSQSHLHGVLAVSDMHFMAFQQENLNILSLLGCYVGDMLSRSEGLGDSQAVRFVAELDTSLRYCRSHSVQSSLLCIELYPGAKTPDIAERISLNIRSLDSAWLPQSSLEHSTVVILLPLIAESSCRAYLNRVVSFVEDEFRIDADKWLKKVTSMQLSANDTRRSCLSFINQSTGVGHSPTAPSGEDNEDIKSVA